jgi:prephenate dehydrogenase
MNTLIIGGMGGFGNFYAKLLNENKFNIFIDDLFENEEEKEKCKKRGFKVFEGDYSKIDLVIISAPNIVAPKIVGELGKKIKNGKGKAIIDFCSVKSFVVPELKKLEKKGFELASLHPMHGPRVSSIKGYPVVFIPINVGGKIEKIKDFFKKEKANLFESNEKEHDKTLSVVQGLTHFSQFVSEKTISDLSINLKKSKNFASPNFELFLSLMSRVVLQNPEMYSQIQTENPFNEEMRKKFVENSVLLDKEAKNQKELKEEIINSAKIFNSLDELLFESDNAVSAIKFVNNTLYENIGKKFLIENISNTHFHYGTIEKIEKGKLFLQEGHKKIEINLSKIRITTKNEMADYKKTNLIERHLDYSFLVPKECDKKIIEKIFAKINNCKTKVIDEFESDKFEKDKKSVTIKVTFFEDDDKERIAKEIEEIINGLKFERR